MWPNTQNWVTSSSRLSRRVTSSSYTKKVIKRLFSFPAKKNYYCKSSILFYENPWNCSRKIRNFLSFRTRRRVTSKSCTGWRNWSGRMNASDWRTSNSNNFFRTVEWSNIVNFRGYRKMLLTHFFSIFLSPSFLYSILY